MQCGASGDRNRRIKATALQKQHQSTHTKRLAVCQSIVDRLPEWTAAIDPINKNDKITTDVFGFGKLARFHHPFEGSSKAFYSDLGVKPVWLHPTINEWDGCITKVFADGAKGIAVVPVSKKDPWFGAMGECVIDWVDIPVGFLLFVKKKGTIVTTDWPYRICLFDAYGQEPSDTHTHTHTHTQTVTPLHPHCQWMQATAPQSQISQCQDLKSYCRIQVQIQILDKNLIEVSIDVIGAFLGWSVNIGVSHRLHPRTKVYLVLDCHQDLTQTSTLVAMASPV